MKKSLFFIPLFFLFAFSKVYAQKEFKILQATYYNWYGGVKGVKGKVFEIQISKTSKKEWLIKKMIINHHKFEVSPTSVEGIIHVQVRIDEGDDPDVVLNPTLENNKFYLEYVHRKTGLRKRLKIPHFEWKNPPLEKQQKTE